MYRSITKLLYLIVCVFLFTQCNNSVKEEKKDEPSISSKQLKNENENGWTASQREQYIEGCTTVASKNISYDDAKAYCECMQQKIEEKYRMSFAEAYKLTSNDLMSSDMQQDIRLCLGQ